MPLFNVIVHEINSITLEVEAENDIEAGRLVEENINNAFVKTRLLLLVFILIGW